MATGLVAASCPRHDYPWLDSADAGTHSEGKVGRITFLCSREQRVHVHISKAAVYFDARAIRKRVVATKQKVSAAYAAPTADESEA